METKILEQPVSVCVHQKKSEKIQKGALQLDLFEPVSKEFQYKVIVTNKTESAKAVVLFHNGRGSQERLFGNAKNDTALSVIPCKTHANRISLWHR